MAQVRTGVQKSYSSRMAVDELVGSATGQAQERRKLLFLYGSRHLSYSPHTMGDKMMELLESKVEVLQDNSSVGEKRSVRGDDGRQTAETAGGVRWKCCRAKSVMAQVRTGV